MTVRGNKNTLKIKKGAAAPFLVRRWRSVLGTVLIVVGIVGLGIPFVSFSIASPEDVLIAGQSLEPSQAGEPVEQVDVSYSDVANRLIIDGAGIDMPVFTGELWSSLEKGAWLMGGTKPGEKGNTVIFGHRFKYLPPLSNTMFRLGGVDYGDQFTVSWRGEDLVYEVREKRIIDPTELSVIEDSGDERVTLITCHPVWSTKQRLVVVGFPVEQ